MLRKTAASVVASVALVSPGVATATPAPEQIVQAVADSAAETYRQTRAQILSRYHEQTAQAQARLEAAEDLDSGWQEYKRATQRARAEANAALKQARSAFQQTVAVARSRG